MYININIGNGDQKEELLALNSGEATEAALLDKGRNLGVVQDSASDGDESMLLFLLLFEPDETGGPIVADLEDVV